MNEPWMQELRADVRDIRDRLARLEERSEAHSDDHEKRLVRLESVAARDNFLRVALGAVGVGLVFAVKYLVGLLPAGGGGP